MNGVNLEGMSEIEKTELIKFLDEMSVIKMFIHYGNPSLEFVTEVYNTINSFHSYMWRIYNRTELRD